MKSLALTLIAIFFGVNLFAQDVTPNIEEKRKELYDKYNADGKKMSKYFPGAFYFIPGSVGDILNDQIFLPQVSECKFKGKRFKKVEDSDKNYVPLKILTWGGKPLKIDSKALLVKSAAGNLTRAVITGDEKNKL